MPDPTASRDRHSDAPTSHSAKGSESPPRDAVIYDGDCPMCRAAVERLSRWDRRGRLETVDLNDPEVQRRWPQLDTEQLGTELHVVDSSGNVYRGAAALRRLSRRLPRLWPLAVPLHIPGTLPVWQKLYRFVARRRYRFAGGEACQGDVCRRHGPTD